MASTVEYGTAFYGAMLQLFGIGYRQGLVEACRCGDEFTCMDLAERLKSPFVLDTLSTHDMDWNEWQFKVLVWTRGDKVRKQLLTLLMDVRRPTHKMAFILHIFKMFYRQGILDWVENRDWITPIMVDSIPKQPSIMRGKCFRHCTKMERFEQLQCLVLNMLKINSELRTDDPDKQALIVPSQRLRGFMERIWSVMQSPTWYDDYD